MPMSTNPQPWFSLISLSFFLYMKSVLFSLPTLDYTFSYWTFFSIHPESHNSKMYPTLHFFGLVGSMPHPPPTRTRHTSHETQGARARGPCHCMLAPTRTNPARSVSFAYFHVMFTIFSWNSFTYLKFLNGNAITLISTISRSRNFFLLHLNTSCQID